MGRIGFQELAVVLGLALLIFGPAKLPEIGKAFGRTIGEFKHAAKEVTITMDDLEVKEVKKPSVNE